MKYVNVKLKAQNGTLSKMINSNNFKDYFNKSFEYILFQNKVPVIYFKDYDESEVPVLNDKVETFDELYDECKKVSDYFINSNKNIKGLNPISLVKIDEIIYIQCSYEGDEEINFDSYEATVTFNLPFVVEEWVNHELRENEPLESAKLFIMNIVPQYILLCDKVQ